MYMEWGLSGSNCWGVKWPVLVIFFYVNAPMVLLILSAFDNTGSLGSPPRQVVYPPV